jgi:hypothetical protein
MFDNELKMHASLAIMVALFIAVAIAITYTN